MKSLLLFGMFLGLNGPCAEAQGGSAQREAARAAAIASQVAAPHFTFRAEWIQPMTGSARQLFPPQYDLRVTRDSLICYLPYMGRSFSAATLNPIDVGFKFTSRSFRYKTARGRKSGWSIRIRPEDQRDVSLLYLTIRENGAATLQINSNSRDPVSYTGTILEAP